MTKSWCSLTTTLPILHDPGLNVMPALVHRVSYPKTLVHVPD